MSKAKKPHSEMKQFKAWAVVDYLGNAKAVRHTRYLAENYRGYYFESLNDAKIVRVLVTEVKRKAKR